VLAKAAQHEIQEKEQIAQGKNPSRNNFLDAIVGVDQATSNNADTTITEVLRSTFLFELNDFVNGLLSLNENGADIPPEQLKALTASTESLKTLTTLKAMESKGKTLAAIFENLDKVKGLTPKMKTLVENLSRRTQASVDIAEDPSEHASSAAREHGIESTSTSDDGSDDDDAGGED
jgi:hypothetical protein